MHIKARSSFVMLAALLACAEPSEVEPGTGLRWESVSSDARILAVNFGTSAGTVLEGSYRPNVVHCKKLEPSVASGPRTGSFVAADCGLNADSPLAAGGQLALPAASSASLVGFDCGAAVTSKVTCEGGKYSFETGAPTQCTIACDYVLY